jgi:hypothetical protein
VGVKLKQWLPDKIHREECSKGLECAIRHLLKRPRKYHVLPHSTYHFKVYCRNVTSGNGKRKVKNVALGSNPTIKALVEGVKQVKVKNKGITEVEVMITKDRKNIVIWLTAHDYYIYYYYEG